MSSDFSQERFIFMCINDLMVIALRLIWFIHMKRTNGILFNSCQHFEEQCENNSLHVQLILGRFIRYRAAKVCYIPYAYNMVFTYIIYCDIYRYQNKAQEAQIKTILYLN